MSFTTYGSRDDSSVKLRTQNQQILTKEKTKLLEMETEKMAERLQELKIAMSREKEERERTFRDGGFWKSGQVGSLGSYPKEVLSKSAKPKDQISKTKVTLLKDEPIVLPERNKGPGTMALMIKQQPLTPKGGSKVKGRRCGQCEEKAAHVNCTECGEDYCASCFTAFHLKGALKKHRSTPIGSGALRTPRGELRLRYAGDECKENIQQMPKNSGDKMARFPVADNGSGVAEKGRMDLSRGDQNDVTGSRKTVAPSSQQRANFTEGKSLLDGTYDAVENQKQFQEALMEWRQGGKPQEIVESRAVQPTIPRADAAVGTSTNAAVRPAIEVKFSGSDLTYAERLMLKKHWRMELGTVPYSSEPTSIPRSTPIITDVTDEEKSHTPSRSTRRSVDAASYSSATGKNAARTSSAGVRFVDSQGEILPTEPKSRPSDKEFVRNSDSWKQGPAARKTFSARMSSERKKISPTGSSQLQTSFGQPKISIAELKKPLSKRDPMKLERSTTSVNEASRSFSTSTRQTSSRPRVRKDAFGSPSEAEVQDNDQQQQQQLEKVVITQTSVEAFDAPRRALSSYKTVPTSKTQLTSVTNKPERLSSSPGFSKISSDSSDKSQQMKESKSNALNESHDLSKMTESQNFGECEQENSEKITGSKNIKIKTNLSSRPGSRTASRQNPRPKSKNEGRPRSRLASHRESGCITKAATEALKSVARMSESLISTHSMDLGAYFTMAVHPDRTEVATPVVSSRLNSAREKGRMRVSNSLYQIGPRSWKPDSSYIQPSTTGHNDPIDNGKGNISKKAKSPDANTLSWTLSQEPASNKSERIEIAETQHFAGNKTGDLETSRDGKLARKVFKPEPHVAQYVLPKQNEAQQAKLRSSENERSVTLNKMIPQNIQRPGSGLQGLNSSRSQLSTGRDSQMGSRTGRESRSGSKTGRESQMIVYDDDDLSVYEEQEFAKQRREIEEEAKERLDSELALESNLAMKGDSKTSPEYKEKAVTGKRSSEVHKLSSKTVSTAYQKLRESMIMNDFEEMEAKLMADYEDEVKALK